MKMIIDIVEGAYIACKAVKDVEDDGRNPLLSYLINAVANSTVLPEQHGRLIDADAFKNNLKWNENIDNAPTILEGTVKE